jgi:hypothetical protein
MLVRWKPLAASTLIMMHGNCPGDKTIHSTGRLSSEFRH